MIEFRVNETATAMLSRAWQVDVLRGLRRTMDYENQLTVGHTKQARLTGKGPFPVSDGRLGVRTNRLRSSLRAAKARIVGSSVTSSIGSNVEYAAAHEFGFRGAVNVRAKARRQRSRNVGKSGRLGVKDKSAVAFGFANVKAFTRQANIPARAPITHGIEDRKRDYERAMSQSIIATLRGLGYR